MARKPRPARTDAPPRPNSRPSWRPAVPPPPVSGAAPGGGGFCGATAWWCVAAVLVDWPADADGEAGADELDAPEAETETETETEAEAPAVVVGRPDAGLLVLAVEVWPPAGDGVRVTEFVADPDDDVSGDGVKVVGTEEPPEVQAETASPSRTAPAARRPAVSHASRVAAGVLSHIFMDPPRTRVRYTR
jgi:hypothetical protein